MVKVETKKEEVIVPLKVEVINKKEEKKEWEEDSQYHEIKISDEDIDEIEVD